MLAVWWCGRQSHVLAPALDWSRALTVNRWLTTSCVLKNCCLLSRHFSAVTSSSRCRDQKQPGRDPVAVISSLSTCCSHYRCWSTVCRQICVQMRQIILIKLEAYLARYWSVYLLSQFKVMTSNLLSTSLHGSTCCFCFLSFKKPRGVFSLHIIMSLFVCESQLREPPPLCVYVPQSVEHLK